MHSAGLELTKLTYTRLEDNLIRHRGDWSIYALPVLIFTPGAVRTHNHQIGALAPQLSDLVPSP